MSQVPDVVPVLSRGRHRNPKRGACFMELASFLAGERWSDHPSCTHPLLAEVARNVNDRTSDEARPLLAPLIPTVIGLHTDDERADPLIALQCALVALPAAPFERQKALAVAVVACQRVLGALDATTYDLEVRIRRALEAAPHATAWAQRFAAAAGGPRHATSVSRFRRHAAPDIVRLSTRAVEHGEDGDRLLRAMLEASIAQVQALQPRRATVEVDPVRWREACSLTG